MTPFEFSYLLLWVIATFLIPVAIILVYQYAHFQRMADAMEARRAAANSLSIGSPFPEFESADLYSGRQANVLGVFSGKTRWLIALSPNCLSCRVIAEELANWSPMLLQEFALIVVCVGDKASCAKRLNEVHPIPVVVTTQFDVPMLEAIGLPCAVQIDEFGNVVDIRNPTSIDELVSGESDDYRHRGIVRQDALLSMGSR